MKSEEKKICGYAATSKSTTVLNYCKIGNAVIDYICDTTLEKIGKQKSEAEKSSVKTKDKPKTAAAAKKPEKKMENTKK